MSDSKDLAIDLGEVVIESFLEDGLIKEIPFLKTLYVIASTARSIPERIFAAKVQRFIKGLPSCDTEYKKKFINELYNDQTKKQKLTEIVLLSLDRSDRLEKAELISIVFVAFLEERILLEEFDSLTTAIVNSDLNLLHKLLDLLELHPENNPPTIVIGFEQLIGAGIVRPNGTPSTDQSGTFTRASDLGLTLFKILRK
jgi:hypothetical protein